MAAARARLRRAARPHDGGGAAGGHGGGRRSRAHRGGRASLLFDGAAKFGAEDRTVISGSAGTLNSRGPDLGVQAVSLTTEAGIARPALEGTWFKQGFQGTMGALLAAVESGSRPINEARSNLDALAMVFAAIASARLGVPVAPGAVRSLVAAEG